MKISDNIGNRPVRRAASPLPGRQRACHDTDHIRCRRAERAPVALPSGTAVRLGSVLFARTADAARQGIRAGAAVIVVVVRRRTFVPTYSTTRTMPFQADPLQD